MSSLTMKELPDFAKHIDVKHSHNGIITVRCKVAGFHFEAQYDDRNVGLYAWTIPDDKAQELFERLLKLEGHDE